MDTLPQQRLPGAAPDAADGDAAGGLPALGPCPWGRQEQTARGQSTGAERGPERVGVRRHPEMEPGLRLTAAGRADSQRISLACVSTWTRLAL